MATSLMLISIFQFTRFYEYLFTTHLMIKFNVYKFQSNSSEINEPMNKEGGGFSMKTQFFGIEDIESRTCRFFKDTHRERHTHTHTLHINGTVY